VTAETRGRKTESATGAVRNVEGSMLGRSKEKTKSQLIVDRGGTRDAEASKPDLVLVVRHRAVPVKAGRTRISSHPTGAETPMPYQTTHDRVLLKHPKVGKT
jgi:hypothetical protein